MKQKLEAFITNSEKYQQGQLVGEWVSFPTSAEALHDAFMRIGADPIAPEIFISEYDCDIPSVYHLLSEATTPDELNYFAKRLEKLPPAEQQKFMAVMEGNCAKPDSLEALIDLTYNLNCFDHLPEVRNRDDLGHFIVEQSGLYDRRALGELGKYLDYEALGWDTAENEGGRFTGEGYVHQNPNSWQQVYTAPGATVPEEYRIMPQADVMNQELTVLMVEPGKQPYEKTINSGLQSLQHEVGGDIEAVYPFAEPVAIVCCETAKLDGQPLNRALRDEDGHIYDIVAGTFMVVGIGEEDFCSLTEKDKKHFSDVFKTPEAFLRINGKLAVIPMDKPERVRPSVLTMLKTVTSAKDHPKQEHKDKEAR